jgi:hypothetical protein
MRLEALIGDVPSLISGGSPRISQRVVVAAA